MLRASGMPDGAWRLTKSGIGARLSVWPTPVGAPLTGGIVGWPGVCYNGPQHHGAKFSSQPTGCSGPVRALC